MPEKDDDDDFGFWYGTDQYRVATGTTNPKKTRMGAPDVADALHVTREKKNRIKSTKKAMEKFIIYKLYNTLSYIKKRIIFILLIQYFSS